MIKAEIIADSNSWLEKRLTTFILEYPRYIHAELMTHRVFSKNSASSRAIPIEKMVGMVLENPAVPFWTHNQKGMQGELVQDLDIKTQATSDWLTASRNMVNVAMKLSKDGIHKQNVNRLLEPWHHIRIILTGTEFKNWFELRDHEKAHPEIQELARQMKKAMDDSLPVYLEPGEYHIPFGDRMPILTMNPNESEEEYLKNRVFFDLKVSTARCARISYNTFEGEFNFEKDMKLYYDLVVSEPLHASPAEHQAQVPTKKELVDGILNVNWVENQDGSFNEERGWAFSNLIGWKQYRKIIEKAKWN